MVEELSSPKARGSEAKKAATPISISHVPADSTRRFSSGVVELDRVLGGGLVHGALVLVGGDPGIGKSTLLLQALGALATQGVQSLYVSAEESLQQVKLRAERLQIHNDLLLLLSETNMGAVLECLKNSNIRVVVVDSIQTVGLDEVESPIGSVSQIRAVTQSLMEHAKSTGVATFVVGHVTKEGAIAGPKVLEHMVDTVLYFEGDHTGPYRILRAHKNRFGSAQEIGVFEMVSEGLRAVSNPSELFLAQRATGPGAAVITSMEGSRPLLLEVQALTAPALYGTPRRTTVGFDSQRLAILCAVLDRRADIQLASSDVYVNVAGGVRINEPAADLGVVLALASAERRRAVPDDLVAIGEVGLSGEVRGISYLAARVQEAAQLGFKRALVPSVDVDRLKGQTLALPLLGVASIADALKVADLT